MNKEFALVYDILQDVYVNKNYINSSLFSKLSNSNLNHSLITKISYGVLEKNITIEYFLKQFLKKKPDNRVYIILKMAAYMHLYLDSIPKYAIANELVNLVKIKINRNLSGFVNATIKNILKNNLTYPNEQSKDYLSVKYSAPNWLVASLIKKYGKTFVNDLFTSNISSNTVIRVNLIEISAENFENMLKENNIKFKNGVLENTYEVDYENLLKLKNSKTYFVQGIPSQQVVLSLNLAKESNLLDLCSAPGGKAVYSAMLYNVKVTACDIHKHRLELIKKYASNYGVKNITTVINDALKINSNFINKYNNVLLDAPCSGTGVIFKKPDILLNKTYNDVLTLQKMQIKMLENASKYVKIGGTITYSTCSIMEEENEFVINEFLKNNKNFKLEKIETKIPVCNCENMITFTPNISGTEGFFIGRLKRYE